MVSFSDSVDSALQTEYEMKFDGYELMELYKVLFDSRSPHLRVIARQMADLFFNRVERLNMLPFDDVDEDEVGELHSTPYPSDVPFPFDAKQYGK